MRLSPNHSRLRIVALACWGLGTLCITLGGRLLAPSVKSQLLLISVYVLALLLLALGVAFWLLGSDRRLGIIVDRKGLLLNLGHSSSFIAWDNIERIGASAYRSDLYSLASRRQLGITLHDVRPYVQSYERRVPASRGVLGAATRLIARVLRPFGRGNDTPLHATLMAHWSQTGYHVLVPESFLGMSVEAFLQLADQSRPAPPAPRKPLMAR